jgi:hypothetical protein
MIDDVFNSSAIRKNRTNFPEFLAIRFISQPDIRGMRRCASGFPRSLREDIRPP